MAIAKFYGGPYGGKEREVDTKYGFPDRVVLPDPDLLFSRIEPESIFDPPDVKRLNYDKVVKKTPTRTIVSYVYSEGNTQ